jgi:hypothetical protein
MSGAWSQGLNPVFAIFPFGPGVLLPGMRVLGSAVLAACFMLHVVTMARENATIFMAQGQLKSIYFIANGYSVFLSFCPCFRVLDMVT